MKRLFTAVTLYFLSGPVWAASFDRPVPQPQSATAEFWFFMASMLLVAALVSVAWLVNKR